MEDRQVRLTVEVPNERLEKAMHSAARSLSRQTRIPGFRPGKAPYQVILNKMGEGVILEEALENLGQEIYRQALDESELEPFAPGTMDEIVSREPLVLRYTVPLKPIVELDEYLKLRIPVEETEISDEAVEKALENLRQSRALIEPVDRPAELSDVVVVDIRGELLDPEEDEENTIVDSKSIELLIDEETDWPIPGIADNLVGLNVGDEKDFEHTFAADYPVKRLQNRAATFQIACKEVKSRFVPEWSDNLAQSLGEFEDLLDLRLKIREGLLEGAKREAEAEYSQQVIDATVEKATITYPPLLLDEELDDLISDLSRRLAPQKLTLEDYLKIEGKTLEELRTELEPQARERLTRALVLGKLAELEELEVAEQEIDDQIDLMVTPFEDQADELRKAFDNPQSRHHIRLDLLTKKAVGRIAAIAKGEGELTDEISEVVEEDDTPIDDNTSKE